MMKQENKKLPTLSLAGAEFYVDATQGLLTDTQNRENRIHIYEMLGLDDHFEMVFDKQIRNLKETDWNYTDQERYEYIWLRDLGVYDPDGANKNLTKEDILFLKDLPVIDIEGVKFLWNEQSSRLLQEDNPWNVIAKNDMTQREGIMGCYFDTQKKWVPFSHELPSDIRVLPAHISFVPTSEINQKILLAQQKKSCIVSTQGKGRKLR